VAHSVLYILYSCIVVFDAAWLRGGRWTARQASGYLLPWPAQPVAQFHGRAARANVIYKQHL
jgi:hypothetical protein